MKFFFDTEFIASRGSLELISIGIVSELGHRFYAECSEYDVANFEQWHYENIMPSLEFVDQEESDITIKESNVLKAYGTYRYIGQQLLSWINNIQYGLPGSPLEFWGWFSSTDWVLFCWLFGDCLVDLPPHWPQYCNDIVQELDRGHTIPSKAGTNHNALDDALWHKAIYDVNDIGK